MRVSEPRVDSAETEQGVDPRNNIQKNKYETKMLKNNRQETLMDLILFGDKTVCLLAPSNVTFVARGSKPSAGEAERSGKWGFGDSGPRL